MCRRAARGRSTYGAPASPRIRVPGPGGRTPGSNDPASREPHEYRDMS